ncbi:hypothetical protein OEZ85_008329 [Tetradesmus obliquus]|uniref:Protein kinase domain-containing protein n=1 Tax=Tetradesmus obliquus TaxID=3088 RepID=A0ABY8TM66_TETOB|nr:hypothetical protein OEZ85_008329 [Tetradesmus obliquus]
MGCCLSTLQAAAVTASQAKSSSVEAAAPDIKAQAPEHVAATTDPEAEKSHNKAAETSTGNEEEYTGAIAPVCELQRRQHLNNLGILYTEPEPRFDDITKLCSMVFKVPIALVSLVDERVQWFKSVQGLPGVDRTPRPTSFCAWTLLPAYPEALVVEDAQRDARFRDNPLVTAAPFIRFYAGCPLVCSNGLRLGSLCIIDGKPRSFDAESCNMLANMAEMVVREMEKDKALEEQRMRQQRQRNKEDQAQLLRVFDCFSEAIMLVDTSGDDWNIVFANEAWESVVGQKRMEGLGFWSVFKPPAPGSLGPTDHGQDYADAIAKQENFELMITYFTPQSSEDTAAAQAQPNSLNSRSSLSSGQVLQYAMAQFRCAATTGLDQHMPLIGIPNFLPSTAEGNRAFYFVALKPVPSPPQQQQQRAQRTSSGSAAGSSAASGSAAGSAAVARRPVQKMASFSLMATDGPFQDIKLGPLLGKGAFGRVYRGMWNGKMVAVKVLEYSQQQNEDGCLLEGLLSEQVQHPHVVRTYKHVTRPLPMAGLDEEDEEEGDGSLLSANGLPSSRSREQMLETWLVLEFCNRGCVADAISKGWFRRKDSMEADMDTVVATAREMAGALSYLHSMNILHGDLTGNNVLLTVTADDKRGFVAKISDFGLSRLVSNEAPVIQTRTYGTVTHMPAELLIEGKMSKAADVYSFGVVLWEMFTGRSPYPGMSHSQVLHSVSTGKVLVLPGTAPPAFAQLVSACLARDPKGRPTFSEIIAQLDAMRPEQ